MIKENGSCAMVDLNKYKQDLDSCYSFANKIIDIDTPNSNDAVVFDIDDTMLSSMKLHKLGILNSKSSYSEVIDAYLKQNVEAIESTLSFYNHIKKYTSNIILITGRPDTRIMKLMTVSNLQDEGYNGWRKIFFCPFKNNFSLIKNYKFRLRKRLNNLGIKIFMNIGDQESDFDGVYSKHEIKLPNPLYKI